MLTTPPLAPKTLAALKELGIRTLEDLQKIGVVRAFLLLKASGLTVTKSTLWQLDALVSGRDVRHISVERKTELGEALKNHPPVAVFPSQNDMEAFMWLAIEQARQSAALGEVPVGAVIVYQGEAIAAAHNTCIGDHNVSHHAEINALATAGKALQNYRLENCDVYITLEPCAMCASALIQARVGRVIYGAAEPKTGAAGSVVDLFADKRLNKHTAIFGGILADECQSVLQDFFAAKRKAV